MNKELVITSIKALLMITFFTMVSNADAECFYSGGINYQILSDNNVSVVRKYFSDSGYSDGGEYEFSHNYDEERFNIPESVVYNGKTYSVTTIGQRAFEDCQNLTTIVLPNTLEMIQWNAFRNTKIQSIVIPDGVTLMGDQLFQGCDMLETVKMPSNITAIPRGAFVGCSRLKSFVFPDKVTVISDGAFCGTGFVSLTLPEAITSIGESAFEGCQNLKEIGLSSGLESIGNYAFYNCPNLVEVKMPQSINRIGNNAFSSCPKLAYVTIPSEVSSIFSESFRDCLSLSLIIVPSKVNSICISAFAGCNYLKSLYLLNSEPCDVIKDFRVESIKIFDICVLFVPNGSKGEYEKHEIWSKFSKIVELDPNSLNIAELEQMALSDLPNPAGVVDQPETHESVYYDSYGRKMHEPINGLNIIRYDNGEIKKLYINR